MGLVHGEHSISNPMKIDFVHFGDAYLPELQAYANFVQSHGHQAQIHRTLSTLPTDAAVLWSMCGKLTHQLARRYPTAIHIHEYASASVPPMAWVKDQIKRRRHPIPNYRIFQNAWVQQRMGFTDGVPCEYRDMGIAPYFFDGPDDKQPPEFDFVYLGEMRRLLHFIPVFDTLAFLRRSVLLVGQVPEDLRQLFAHHANLTILGGVPHAEVPAQLRRARFGLNLVPQQLPYSKQTSTKLIEYCAAGLPVVTTDYSWVRKFELDHKARFAFIPKSAIDASYPDFFGLRLDQQTLLVPNVRSLEWPRILAGMQIWKRIGLERGSETFTLPISTISIDP